MTILNYTNMEFSFEMYWKKKLVLNNGFKKVNWIFQIEINSLKGFKGISVKFGNHFEYN